MTMKDIAMANSSYVALVTGGNRGIGLEVARQLASRGCRVVIGARTNEGLAAGIAAVESGVEGVILDVTKPNTIAAAAAELDGRFGRLDVLVNNAAIAIAENVAVLKTSADDLRATFETNLFGAIAVAQAFVPGMVKRRYGRVVNVSSRAGRLATMGTTYAPAYSMSKTALNGFTKMLAVETRGSGVRVNSACPGWVRTDMGGPNAPRSVQEGAETLVWLATLPATGPTGGFFADRKQIEW
jgi:NAD(P)-dependent dehydrogenase (short-subunit alcohol dehydrogenase family)